MSYSRLLSPIEFGVAHFGMNLMVSFDAENLSESTINRAVILATQKYPYLRMTLIKDDQNRVHLVEKTSEEMNEFRVKFTRIETIDEFNNWERRFNIFSSINYDLSKFIFYIEVYHFIPNKYQLYFAVNHAGCDGRSDFAMLKDILFFMDSSLSNQNIDSVKSKPILDLFSDLKHSYDIESLRKEPVFKCEYHLFMKSLDRHETNEANLNLYRIPYISEFFQFDEQQSEKLFRNCKLNSTTVQGVISVANMLALINEKNDLKDSNNPIDCLNVALVDMRYLFGLEIDDVFKAPSCLTWVETLTNRDVNLWNIAANVSKRLREMRNSNEGLKWWVKALNGVERPLLSSFASSIGVIDLGENKLRNIRVNDLRFFLSFPTTPFETNSVANNHINVHAFTFRGKLTVVFGHTFPSLGINWGKNYARNVFKIIEAFSQTDRNIPLDFISSQLERYNIL